MSSITRPVLSAALVLVLHQAHAVPVTTGGSAHAVIEVADLDRDGRPDTFGATVNAGPAAQSGASVHERVSPRPLDAPEPKGWLLVFAVVFGLMALNRKLR